MIMQLVYVFIWTSKVYTQTAGANTLFYQPLSFSPSHTHTGAGFSGGSRDKGWLPCCELGGKSGDLHVT